MERNPYESAEAEPLPSRDGWQLDRILINSSAALLWVALPVGWIFLRPRLREVVEDFGLELSTVIKILLHPTTDIVLAAASVAIMVGIVATARRRDQRLYSVVALLAGVAIVVTITVCLTLFLLSFMMDLSG